MTDAPEPMPEKIAAWRFLPERADEWIHGGWSEDHDHKTTEYIRADLASTAPVGVRVKPLEWQGAGRGCDAHWVDTTGIYQIEDSVLFIGCQESGIPCDHDDEAKAVAQADYDRRTRDAIKPQPITPAMAAEIAIQGYANSRDRYALGVQVGIQRMVCALSDTPETEGKSDG